MIRNEIIPAFKVAPLFRLGRVNFCFVDYDKLYDYTTEVEEDKPFKHIFGHTIPSFVIYLYPINLKITPEGLYKTNEGYDRYAYLNDVESRHIVLCKTNVKLLHPFESIHCLGRHKNTTIFSYYDHDDSYSDVVCLDCGVTLSTNKTEGRLQEIGT